MKTNRIICGDCLNYLKGFEKESIDLIYMDPPFYTQQKQSLSTRDDSYTYEFQDT